MAAKADIAQGKPLLQVCFVTLMPKMLALLEEDGVIGTAIKQGKIALSHVDPREFAHDKHKTVDDTPYGGGPGMVLKPEPLAAAIDHARSMLPQAHVLCMAVDGQRFDDAMARQIACEKQLIIVCGRYQGIDERIVSSRVDSLVSLGDFVASGGELPGMVLVDAVARLLPGVLGSEESVEADSFAQGELAPPCYTRPEDFEGMKVPPVLLSGDHAKIKGWREKQAKDRTAKWQKRQRVK